MGFLDFLGPVGDVLGAIGGSSAQRSANQTNIRLQREQQAWEERMSSSAVQRRADDIEKAGGNRALAFVNGSEASTPTVTPARVESTFKPDWIDLTSKQLALAQIKNVDAQTRAKNAEASILEADVPYSGANAQAKADLMQEQLRKVGSEIANLNLMNSLNQVNWDIAELDLKQKEKLYPLQEAAQRLLNTQTAAGTKLTEANITSAEVQQLKNRWETYLLQLGSEEAKKAAEFWKNAPAGKFLLFIKQIVK